MADSNCSNQAWVTLTTNDSYALGALVLAHSLRRCGTTRKVVVLVTNDVTEVMMNLLSDVFDEVVNVATMDSEDEINLNLLERPELGVTFTKLHCWKLTQYTKCVFLDADTMMVQNSDELFDREEFSAAPDAGWPDCFNSGVFVFVPSLDTYRALIEHASREGSFDGGDQGLLNTFFSDWPTADIKKHLPFLYNMVATATYTYLPAFKKFGNDVKIVHFIGVSKPWHVTFDSEGQPIPKQKEDRHAAKHLINWWHIFDCSVRHRLPGYSKAEARQEAAGHSAAGSLEPGKAEEVKMSMSESFENKIQKQAWEAGHPDYMGRSSMEKIIEKIDSNLSSQKPDNDTGEEVPINAEAATVPEHLDRLELAALQFNALFPNANNLWEGDDGTDEKGHRESPDELRERQKRNWELGRPDYMGFHSFEKIQQKLDQLVCGNAAPPSVGNNTLACTDNTQHPGPAAARGDSPRPHHDRGNGQEEHAQLPANRPLERDSTTSRSRPVTEPKLTVNLEPSKEEPAAVQEEPMPDPSSFDFVLHKLYASLGNTEKEKENISSSNTRVRTACPTCGQTLPEDFDFSRLERIEVIGDSRLPAPISTSSEVVEEASKPKKRSSRLTRTRIPMINYHRTESETETDSSDPRESFYLPKRRFSAKRLRS